MSVFVLPATWNDQMNVEPQNKRIKRTKGIRHAIAIGLGLLWLTPTNLVAEDQDTGASTPEAAPPAKPQRPQPSKRPSIPPPIDLPAESELTFPTDI